MGKGFISQCLGVQLPIYTKENKINNDVDPVHLRVDNTF